MAAVLTTAFGLLVLAAGAGVAGAAASPGPSDAPEYWFDDWHVESLWSQGIRGQGITIGEIDTGVNAELSALRGRVLRGTDFGGRGDGRTDREIDEFGHGTAMASIMVGRTSTLSVTGLAPDAKILPIAVPINGTTDAERPDSLPTAIRYAADHGAKIISLSLGGKRTPSLDDDPCPVDEQSAVFHALRKGALVVASVGNTGPTRNVVEEPAACLGVVSVGAVDSRGDVADFSSRQPYLTLSAPGVAVASLGRVPGQAYAGKGTSQAAAVASAALALVWSANPKSSASSVLARVLATLDDRRSDPSPALGYGIVNPHAAVTTSVAGDAPNPVFDQAAPFLARADAYAASKLGRAPAPAGRAGAPSAAYSVDAPARLFTPRVLGGAAAALAGLLLLLGLAVSILRTQRLRSMPVPASQRWPAVPPAPSGPPIPLAQPVAPPRRALAADRRPRPRPTSGEVLDDQPRS